MAASDEKRHFQLLLVACFRHRSCPAYRSRQDRQFAGAKLAAQIGLQAGVPRKSNCYNSKGLLPGLSLFWRFQGRISIIELLSARNVAELAKSLAQDVARRYPPAIANSPVQVVSQQRLSDILEEVFARVTSLGRENTLGWYKRARLRRNFRWELNELGYDKKFVDRATEGLLLRASRAASLKS